MPTIFAEIHIMNERVSIKEFQLESTQLLWNTNTKLGPDRARILVGLMDAGETNALLPVIRKLQELPSDLFVMANDPGRKLLLDKDIGFSQSKPFDAHTRVEKIKPDVILTGFSSNPQVEMALTAKAINQDTPVIWVEDYPGDFFIHYRTRLGMSQLLVPNIICAVNEGAKKLNLQYAPDFNPNNIIITGQPAFDRFGKEDIKGTRKKTRESLGIPHSDKLIVFVGGVQEESPEALKVLVDGLTHGRFQNYQLAIRRHSRDRIEKNTYQQITTPIATQVVDTDHLGIDNVAMSADLVVSIMSTEGDFAVYRQIPSLRIRIPDILALSESGLNPPPPPDTVLDGSSPAIESRDEIHQILPRLLSDEKYLSELRGKMANWQSDGKAAERVVAVVNQIAEPRKKARLFKQRAQLQSRKK